MIRKNGEKNRSVIAQLRNTIKEVRKDIGLLKKSLRNADIRITKVWMISGVVDFVELNYVCGDIKYQS
jgi:hypothetical protein